MPTWVILGCGYTGKKLGDALIASGQSVVATTRSADTQSELHARWPSASVHLTESLDVDTIAALVPVGSIVVNSIPPRSGGEIERAVARGCADAARLIYLSSTGVYGRGDGSWIDEDTPTGPIGERGVKRLEAESALLGEAKAVGLAAVSLRIGGIYGPGRGVHARLRRGDYRVYGEGSSLVSRIHVTDLVGAIVRAGSVETLARSAYCVVDNEPTSSREHADGLAALLGIDPPPTVPLEEASASARSMLDANRRVSNRRAVEELKWTLRFPSWREGAADLLESDD